MQKTGSEKSSFELSVGSAEKVVKHVGIVKDDNAMISIGTWESKHKPKSKSNKYVPLTYWNSSSDGFLFYKVRKRETKIHKFLQLYRFNYI